VFRGRWNFNDVAIKVLSNKKFTAAALEEFRQEAAIMAKMRSDYIVQLRGYCESPSYCLVMEYMPVGSLYDVLHNDQALPWHIRLRIGLDVSYGLAQLHNVQILHRDLKSLNVLLYEAGGLLRTKLADFGLSRMKTESNSLSTVSSKSVGTLAWMAPELLSLKPKYSVQSDMYGYGMVLWELAEREVPFAGAHPNVLHTEIAAGRAKEEFSQELIDSRPQYISLAESCWTVAGKRPSAAEAVKLMESLFHAEMKEFEESKSVLGRPVVGVFSGVAPNLSSASTASSGLSQSGLLPNLASQASGSGLPASAHSSQVSEAAKELAGMRLAAEDRRVAEEKQRLEAKELEAEVRQLKGAERVRELAAKKVQLEGGKRAREAQTRDDQAKQEKARQGELQRQREQEEAQKKVREEAQKREAAEKAKAEQERIRQSWQSGLEPKTQRVFYRNSVTQEQVWSAPEGYVLEGAPLEMKQEADRQAAYTLERGRKEVAERAQVLEDQKEVPEFLRCIAYGEQKQAEEMLKKRPSLRLRKGVLRDPSGREFKEITGFQYALWALDWHLWTMLLKYLSQEEAGEQWKELERVGTVHGKQASWQGLIEAYTGYMPLATAASAAGWSGAPFEAAKRHWIQRIGGSQLLLPAHVVNEYCHESRSFYPLPDFGKGEELTRSRLSSGVDWYDVRCGKEWGHVRGSYGKACHGNSGAAWATVGNAGYDKGAVVSLLETRQRQLAELGKTLAGPKSGWEVQQLEAEKRLREAAEKAEKERQAALQRQKAKEEALKREVGEKAKAEQERIKASWVSKIDPKTKKVYYTNTVTQATSQTAPEGYKPEGAALEAEQEEARGAAYLVDQQKRAGEVALREAKDSKEVEGLLNYVVQGEQEKAESLLKANPELTQCKGTVTDLSKRTFKGITAFQYAVWALDWPMWKMLL
jgi:hypothetical protein